MLSDHEFTEFVRTRGPALLRTASFLAGGRHDGEDLLQQSLANAYPKLRRIKEPAALEGYVRTTMVRAAIATSRKPWRRRETTTETLPELAGPDAHRDIDERGDLWPLLRKLPPQQRAVIVLRFYEDLTEAQIAKHLGCSTGTVKSHASRAMAKLRDQFPTTPATDQRETRDE